MSETRPSGLGSFAVLVLALMVVAIATTIGVTLLATEAPRGLTPWLFAYFLSTIELLVGMWTLNAFARARCRYRPSGATIRMVWSVLAVYAMLGLAAIVLYTLARQSDGAGDVRFAAGFVAGTVFFAVVSVILYGYDLFFTTQEQPILEKRKAHAAQSVSLLPVLAGLRALHPNDPAMLQQLSRLIKRLEGAQLALSHSHGGGAGSYDDGPLQGLDPAAEQTIRTATAQLSVEIASLDPKTLADKFSALDRATTQIESAIGILHLT